MLDVIKLWFSILGQAVNQVSHIANTWSNHAEEEKVYTEFAEMVEFHLENKYKNNE